MYANIFNLAQIIYINSAYIFRKRLTFINLDGGTNDAYYLQASTYNLQTHTHTHIYIYIWGCVSEWEYVLF